MQELIAKHIGQGIIFTLAGGGANGFADNVPATGTSLSSPYGISQDGAGNLYIADSWYARVRKIQASSLAVDVGKSTAAIPITINFPVRGATMTSVKVLTQG
jgi:hypothetical protein